MGADRTEGPKLPGRRASRRSRICAPIEWASATGFSPAASMGVTIQLIRVSRSSSYSLKSWTKLLRLSWVMRPEPPWPRQSMVATAKPRPRNSSITSKYFSMNSVCPFRTRQVPRARTSGSASNRAARKVAPTALMGMGSKRVAAGIMTGGIRLCG